jgi:FtsZ-binding cell division protein ZapB
MTKKAEEIPQWKKELVGKILDELEDGLIGNFLKLHVSEIKEYVDYLYTELASLRSELERVKKENESLKEIEVLYSKILDGINKHQAAVRKPR